MTTPSKQIQIQIQKIFGNRILRPIFFLKKDENGVWRRLHSMYRSSNIVRVIISRRLRWVIYLARIERGMNIFTISKYKSTGKIPVGRLGLDGRKILKLILKK